MPNITTFVSDQQVMQAIADALGKDVSELEERWRRRATDANQGAYADIVSNLQLKGFSPDQIAAWTYGARFNLDLALRWALLRGGATEEANPPLFKALEKRQEELEGLFALVTSGGLAQAPGGGEVGGISSGKVTAADQSDPNWDRRGLFREGWNCWG